MLQLVYVIINTIYPSDFFPSIHSIVVSIFSQTLSLSLPLLFALLIGCLLFSIDTKKKESFCLCHFPFAYVCHSCKPTTAMWKLKQHYDPYGNAHFRHCRTLIWKKLYGAIRRKAITIYGEWELVNTTLVMRESKSKSKSIPMCHVHRIERNGMKRENIFSCV